LIDDDPVRSHAFFGRPALRSALRGRAPFPRLRRFAAAQDPPLKIAVYDAPPYGHLEPDGSVDGVSVDLWRRAAESLGREYHLIPVAQMEEVLQGLERKDYDVAIGAITMPTLSSTALARSST
jgi:ABC-type amino acid transport substrate-binding protein